MNWMALVATVSVVATAGVAIWTKAIDAKSKRDDRHHQLALEYETRARQDKSNALKALISASLYVKRQARLAQDINSNEEYPRAATIRALGEFTSKLGGDDGIAEVMAYAAEPVRQAVDLMLGVIDAQRGKHLLPLLGLQAIRESLNKALADLDSPHPMTAETLDRVQRLMRQETVYLDQIGRDSSDLNVGAVIALCDRMFDAARKDLRGGSGTDGSPQTVPASLGLTRRRARR